MEGYADSINTFFAEMQTRTRRERKTHAQIQIVLEIHTMYNTQNE